MFLARARTNSLRLEEAKGRGIEHYNKECKLCKQGIENLTHFIAECPVLEGKRKQELFNNTTSDPRQRTIDLLFKQNRHQEVGKMIKDLWYRRRTILKCKEDEQKRTSNRLINNDSSLSKSNPGPMRSRYTSRRRRVQSSPRRGIINSLNIDNPDPGGTNHTPRRTWRQGFPISRRQSMRV